MNLKVPTDSPAQKDPYGVERCHLRSHSFSRRDSNDPITNFADGPGQKDMNQKAAKQLPSCIEAQAQLIAHRAMFRIYMMGERGGKEEDRGFLLVAHQSLLLAIVLFL